MSISLNDVQQFVTEHMKLLGIAEVFSAGVINTACQLGGAMFWRQPWYFAERKKNVVLTAGTSEYGTQDKLESGVDGIVGIRRMTSADYGFDMIEETPEAFDMLYPYPGAETQGKPAKYKAYYKNGYLYFGVFPVPDAADTLEVTYRLGWDIDHLGLIPDDFVDVFMEGVLCFALPMKYRTFQKQVYDSALYDALSVNSPSRKRVPNMRVPGYRSALSASDRALEMGYDYDDGDW